MNLLIQSVSTQWGSSETFIVELVRISSSPNTQTFDVDATYNGSIPVALAAVAKVSLSQGTTAEVVLGAKTYMITEHLAVPAGTSIKGAGAAATTLTFSLRPPQRGEPGAAFEMVCTQSPASFATYPKDGGVLRLLQHTVYCAGVKHVADRLRRDYRGEYNARWSCRRGLFGMLQGIYPSYIAAVRLPTGYRDNRTHAV